MSRKGDWIQCYTGGRFYPLDPRPEEVKLEDIAHSLSLTCRYAGHCKFFYSVAQHSVLVSELLETSSVHPDMSLWGLLHDAPEAYIGDISRPLKQYLLTYDSGQHRRIEEHEKEIMDAICKAFGIRPVLEDAWPYIKRADNMLLATEARDLMSPLDPDWHKWIKYAPTMPQRVEYWGADLAESRFIRRFDQLKQTTVL